MLSPAKPFLTLTVAAAPPMWPRVIPVQIRASGDVERRLIGTVTTVLLDEPTLTAREQQRRTWRYAQLTTARGGDAFNRPWQAGLVIARQKVRISRHCESAEKISSKSLARRD